MEIIMAINFMKIQRELQKNEYLGSDGLVYCSKCKTPKQMLIEGHYCHISCKCEMEIVQAEELEVKRKLIESRRKDYIPVDKFRNFRFSKDDGQTPKTKLICERYVEKFAEMKAKGMGLLFFGDVGTGKTFYEYCIANELIDREYFVKCVNLISIIQTAQKFKEDFDTAMEQHYKSDLLIIDDIGVERETSFAAEAVYKFIDGCYIRDIPILASTNNSIDEMKQIMEAPPSKEAFVYARIYDRLFERCYPIRLTKVKRRVNLSQENQKETERILGLNN